MLSCMWSMVFKWRVCVCVAVYIRQLCGFRPSLAIYCYR